MAKILEMPGAISYLKTKREERRQKPAAPVKRSPNTRSENIRKGLLAKVHVAKAQLGMDDADWRALLEERFGVRSSALLSLGQLESLAGHLEKRGWTPSRIRKPFDRHGKPHVATRDDSGMGREGQMRKIEALLAELGRAEGRYMPWDYAAAILKHQTGLTRLEYAEPSQLRGVIAALSKNVASKRRHADAATV